MKKEVPTPEPSRHTMTTRSRARVISSLMEKFEPKEDKATKVGRGLRVLFNSTLQASEVKKRKPLILNRRVRSVSPQTAREPSTRTARSLSPATARSPSTVTARSASPFADDDISTEDKTDM